MAQRLRETHIGLVSSRKSKVLRKKRIETRTLTNMLPVDRKFVKVFSLNERDIEIDLFNSSD